MQRRLRYAFQGNFPSRTFQQHKQRKDTKFSSYGYLYKRRLLCHHTPLDGRNVPDEELLNPSRVASLIRKQTLLYEACQNVQDKERLADIQRSIQKIEKELEREKKSLMTKGLKQLFVGQSIVTVVVGGLLASNHFPFVENVPLAMRTWGFWMVWLFTIPSLRARKPSQIEKNALNVAFLLCPLVNITIPMFYKDTFTIWLANVLLLSSLYGFYFFIADKDTRKKSQVKLSGILR